MNRRNVTPLFFKFRSVFVTGLLLAALNLTFASSLALADGCDGLASAAPLENLFPTAIFNPKYDGGLILTEIMSHLDHLENQADGNSFLLTLKFDQGFEVRLIYGDDVPRFRPYAIRFPKELHYRYSYLDGIFKIRALDGGDDALEIKVNIPFFPDGIYFRGLRADVATGDITVIAGLFGNHLGLVARGQLSHLRLAGFDHGESSLSQLKFQMSSDAASVLDSEVEIP